MTKKSILISYIFFTINVLFIVFFRRFINQTIYSTNNIIAYLSIFFLTLVILFKEKNHWLLLSLVFYVKHAYFFYLISFYIKNGYDINISLPYISPREESFIMASTVMKLEFLVVFIGYIVTKCKYFNFFVSDSKIKFNNLNGSYTNPSKNKALILFILILLSSNINYPVIDLVRYVLIMFLFFEINELIASKNKKNKSQLVQVTLNFIVTILLLMGRNRKRIIYFGYAAFYYLQKKFPNIQNVLKKNIFIAVVLLVSVLTTTRFANTKLVDNLLNLNTFSSYFLTVDKVATGLEVKDLLPRSPLIQLLVDMIRPVIFLGKVLDKYNVKYGSLFYNERISFGGLRRNDQIFPFAAQTSLTSPIVMIIIIVLIIKKLNYLEDKEYYDDRMFFLAKYTIFILSLFPVINVTIIVNTLTFNILPLYLVIRMSYTITYK